jgi:hypothetical protein
LGGQRKRLKIGAVPVADWLEERALKLNEDSTRNGNINMFKLKIIIDNQPYNYID